MIYQKVAKNIMLPTLDFLRGSRVAWFLRILEKTQWLKPQEIANIQRKKLRSLMRYSYENVPYYHRIFKERELKPEDIRTEEDLIKLPVLTKDTVRNNFKDLIAKDFPKRYLILNYTGGSTGEPLIFYTTKMKRDWGIAATLRAHEWAGFKVGDKHALIWGSLPDLSRYAKLRKKLLNSFQRCIVLSSHELSEKSLEFFVKILKKFRPKVIRGYASAIYLLSKYVESQGIDFNVETVITSAEKLYSYQRESIEKALGCEVYDFYGSREFPSIASECCSHSGYHISAENIVLEFVENGERVAYGEQGEILVTDLNSYGFPFIRYRIGDVGIPMGELCSCGRGLPLMKSIEGRITDIIITKSGRFISTPVLTLVFRNKHIKKYQIVQETLEKFIVKLVVDEGFDKRAESEILKKLSYYLGNEANIIVKYVDSIPSAPSGKTRVVISRVSERFFVN